MSYFYGFILTACLAVGLVASTPFEACSWYGVPPNEVRIENCTEIPCSVILGANATGEMDFTAPFNLTKLRPRITAWAYGISIDIPIPQEDGCETLVSGNCPLEQGDNATYTFTMSVSSDDYSYYSGIQAGIEFAFLDEDDRVAICAQVPAIIES